MRAYKETYLNNAAKIMGDMIDYAVNDCQLNGGLFFQMFITSGLAEQFEHGNPKIAAGMSGAEIAMHAMEAATGTKPSIEPLERDCRTPEYWAGWALAHYQWYTAMSFSAILRFMPFADVMRMYPTLHEADITKFYRTVEDIRSRECPQTNLKRIREAVGLSQARLAREAGVSLRSIQTYEQRNKDVNKAQAITLAKIARVLSCEVEDLLEKESELSEKITG